MRWPDIFVRNQLTGAIVRVSVSTDGVEGNGASSSPAISRDGRFVAFVSLATNLIDGRLEPAPPTSSSTIATPMPTAIFDEPGAIGTSRVSVATGGLQANERERRAVHQRRRADSSRSNRWRPTSSAGDTNAATRRVRARSRAEPDRPRQRHERA